MHAPYDIAPLLLIVFVENDKQEKNDHKCDIVNDDIPKLVILETRFVF